MKKALIATWIEHDNYGSLLQAYCLQEILKELLDDDKNDQLNTENVWLLNFYSNQDRVANSLLSKLSRIMKDSFNNNFTKIMDRILLGLFRKKIQKRSKIFDNFRRRKLNLYPENPIFRSIELKKLIDFDLYVAGGDQIWNPKLLDKVYLLDWTPKYAKKVSYAPSVCVNHLSKLELSNYKILDSFKKLSVREYTGAVEQIGNLIHKNIIEVVDPVILYGGKQLIAKCKKNNDEDYAAVYLLNGMKNRHKIYANFLKKSNLMRKIIPTTNSKNLFFETVLSRDVDWSIGPMEFINTIYNARILITDSFHGVIIALLLHKDFIVLSRDEERSEQDNRLIDLLRKVGLEQRFNEIPKNLDEVDSIDWDKINIKIEKMRKQSRNFLKEVVSTI